MGANELLAELADIGRARDGYTRLSWDPATMTMREWFAGKAAELGLEMTEDGNGNQLAWWGHGPGALLLGSLPGIWIGSHLSAKVPEHILRRILASMLVLIGSKLVFA